MQQIKHLVILMMENRSFDHFLGSLSLLEGRTDVDGLKASFSNPDVNGDPVPVWDMDGIYSGYGDPPHGWDSQHGNWNEGAMDGFVKNYQASFPDDPKTPMGFYTRKTLPVSYNLTDKFTICDRWFSSCLSSTWPNRKYLLSGKRDSDDDTQTLPPLPGFETTPFFDAFEDWINPDNGRKCTWKSYFSDLPFLAFWYRFAATHALSNFHTVLDFVTDCQQGTLPEVSIIDPPFGLADDHPSYDVRRGEKFIGLMIDALTVSDSWKDTALVLMFDENGAFYDHVAPPSTFDNGEEPDGDLPLGFRTPAIVISPYSGRKVCHETFDHTSIMKSIYLRWGSETNNFDPAIFNKRWTMAPDIWSTCFDFDQEPIPAGSYTQSEVYKDFTWEQGIHQVMTQPPGGVLVNLERVFLLPTHGPLDNRAKLFDTLAAVEREVVRSKRLLDLRGKGNG